MDAMTLSRTKKIIVCALLLLALAANASIREAQEGLLLFRIGSAGIGGLYFPIANAIAKIFNGLSLCAEGQACGLPGLLAVAQVSNGSVANVRDLRGGSLEAGLVQSDVAYHAYYGTGLFEQEGPYKKLRIIGNLYAEHLHIVVPAASTIQSVADLKGKRISFDEPGSGTLASARFLLQAYGLRESDLQAVYLKPPLAASALQEKRLDAFFLVAGYPATTIAQLALTDAIRLVPCSGSHTKFSIMDYPYFFYSEIPADAYHNVATTPTLAVGAQLLVDARLDEELAYEMTRLLWSEQAHQILSKAHVRGREVRLERALDGVMLPLHRGAVRYYREVGLL
jgi:TRAP transporter TAXI family solute receptor